MQVRWWTKVAESLVWSAPDLGNCARVAYGSGRLRERSACLILRNSIATSYCFQARLSFRNKEKSPVLRKILNFGDFAAYPVVAVPFGWHEIIFPRHRHMSD